MSILEALSFNMQIVAWDLKVYKDIYGKAICVIKKFDHSRFAKKIITIMKNKKKVLSKSLRQKLLVRYSVTNQVGKIDSNILKI